MCLVGLYFLNHCHLQVLCWGVRNMKKFELTSVTSPSIEFECAGGVLQSDVIKDTKKNPNFENPVLTRMIVVIVTALIGQSEMSTFSVFKLPCVNRCLS